MPSYVAFLRAVNVGKRQVKMAALRGWLEDAGFTDVETYIQTGNVRVTTPLRSKAKVERELEQLLLDRCGFEVPCIVFTPTELAQVHADAEALERPPYADSEGARRYAVFFKKPPGNAELDQVAAYAAELERIWVVGRVAHVWIAGSMMDAQVFAKLGKVLDVGTNRSFTVLKALAERWS